MIVRLVQKCRVRLVAPAQQNYDLSVFCQVAIADRATHATNGAVARDQDVTGLRYHKGETRGLIV
jgi:hypothetical protein